MRFEPAERQDDTRWTGEENKRLGQQSWEDLKAFRPTIMTGTAAGAAMATVYVILAMNARGAGYQLHFAGHAATAAFLGIGIPFLLFAMLRTKE